MIDLIFGIFFKVVDEIEDVGYEYLNDYKEYIKTLCTIFAALALYNNVYLSICFILVIIPASYFVNEIDKEYWKTLLPLPFITFALNYASVDFTILSQHIIFFLFMFVSTVVEGMIIPEETSMKKILMRIVGIVFVVLMLLYTNNPFITPFLYCALGYIGTSVVFKTLLAPYAMSETAVQKAAPPPSVSSQQLDKTHQAP